MKAITLHGFTDEARLFYGVIYVFSYLKLEVLQLNSTINAKCLL